MTARLLTGAIAAVGLSLGAASIVANGNWDQPPASQTQPPAGQPQAGQPPAGQPPAGQPATSDPQRGGAGRGQGRGPAEPLLGPGPSAARFPKNADEFDQMFNQVKNWGRWGPDDQLGAANLIPGPNSTELAIHIGHRQAGWPGLLVAGSSFILPAMLIEQFLR